MNNAYLLIGGNIGDRLGYLQRACNEITNKIGEIIKSSSIYETAPWGNYNQSNFLNQALLVKTALEPSLLLQKILGIEEGMGRIRTAENQPRTIDIDILYFNDVKINSNELTIPHPRIFSRKFVLVPMHEIAPYHIDPVHQKSIEQMLNECKDDLEVNKFSINVHNND
ncbi:MAG: 2-amino-4-hydroxy-6-hydroxymethyldihydropteridine diphosphokinase [Bacteroidota bacterium]|jgi:2-amino-4-hydroxy-6-hydroxymethyldihydropteridine diphosphokinase